MKKGQLLGSMLLLLTAMIWGCAFVAQSVAMDSIGPFSFGALRFALGGLSLLPVIAAMQCGRKKTAKPRRRDLWIGGTICGLCLFSASSFQQIGIIHTTVGKAGFLTTLYVVFVPLAAWLFFRKRPSKLIVVSIVEAVSGLYMLCLWDDFSVNPGDAYVLVSALLYTVHILAVDHFVKVADGVQLSCIQFFVSAFLSLAVALLTEQPITPEIISAAWLPIVYTGVLSSGVGYTLQILGQRRTPPAVASLLMSLESVFSAVGGAVILGQLLNLHEIVGCLLMFSAVIVAQCPVKKLPAK